MRNVLTILFALLVAPSSWAANEQPVQQSVQAFYSWVLAHPGLSLPSPKERTELAHFISPELIQLLTTASETEDRCIKSARNEEKPNIIEGALFAGNNEGATEVAYGAVRVKGAAAHMKVHLTYVDDRYPKAHAYRVSAWSDSVELRLNGKQWLVSNIQYQQGHSLVTLLKRYITEGKHSCGAP